MLKTQWAWADPKFKNTMKHFIFLLLLIHLSASPTSAQQASGKRIDQILSIGLSLQPVNPDSALIYSRQALLMARQIADKPRVSHALNLISIIQRNKGNLEEAETAIVEALNLRRQFRSDSLVVSSLINYGAVSQEMGDNTAALSYYEEALPLAQNRKDIVQIAKIYINIANVWGSNGDYKKAIYYNELCQDLLKNKSFPKEAGLNYYGMGNHLLNSYIEKGETGNLEKSRQSYEKAIQFYGQTQELYSAAHAHNGLGSCYRLLHDFDKASEEFQNSLKLFEQLKDSSGMLDVYYNIASLAQAENRPQEALYALNKLEYLLEKEGDEQDFAFVRNQFSDSDEKISKTLVSNQASIVKAQLESQQAAQTKLILFIAIGILCLLIIGGYIYARQKIRTDRQLLAQQKQIIGQQEQLHLRELDNLLRQQEIEFIRKRLEGEEAECRRIAKELHDGVGGLLVSAKWNLESAIEEAASSNGMVAAKLKDNLRLQDESYLELRKVVRELERDRIPWWEELQKFCERLSGNRQTGIRFYRHGLDESAGGALGEEARLITQELITNGLKHAKATQINVQIGKVDHILSIVVEDDGVGFDKSRSFDGYGLKNIAERVSRLGGSLSFETSKETGTSVFVDIPLPA